MDTIKKFLEVNARVLIAAVVVIALVIAISLAGSNDDESTDSDQSEQTSEVQEQPQEEPERAEPAKPDGDVIGSEPSAGPVEVQREGDTYEANVREGDNQTVIVRQIVNEYLADEDVSLNASQRLFMETTLVNEIGRNDVVFSGDSISVEKTSVMEVADQAGELSQAAQDRWATYL